MFVSDIDKSHDVRVTTERLEKRDFTESSRWRSFVTVDIDLFKSNIFSSFFVATLGKGGGKTDKIDAAYE